MSAGLKLIDAERDGDEFVKLFESGGTVPLRVTGTSMLPLLRPGRSTVWLEGKKEPPKRGDILLFRRRDGAFVLHRVRKVLDGRYVMNGDAQSWCEVISEDMVIAVVRRIDTGRRVYTSDSLPMRVYRLLWTPTYPARRQILSAAMRLRRAFIRPKGRNK